MYVLVSFWPQNTTAPKYQWKCTPGDCFGTFFALSCGGYTERETLVKTDGFGSMYYNVCISMYALVCMYQYVCMY